MIIGKLASLANTTGLSTRGWVPGQQGQAGRESQGARMLLQWLLMGEGFLPNQKKSNSDILITDTNVWPGMGFTVIFFSKIVYLCYPMPYAKFQSLTSPGTRQQVCVVVG